MSSGLRETTTRGLSPPNVTGKARLRVALLAGTLGRGGAEKQLVYMVRALLELRADVRLYTLTRGEVEEARLCALGIRPIWVGRVRHPVLRLAALVLALRRFRPHVVQSAHFFCNLYVGLAARLNRSLAIGAARGDVLDEVAATGRWARWLLRVPSALIVNAQVAKLNATTLGIDPERVHVLPNVIDLQAFAECAATGVRDVTAPETLVAISVANLIPSKRMDRFLAALALVRRQGVALQGIVVGDGPERGALELMAQNLGLSPSGVTFLGGRGDVPALLCRAHMLVHTSDHEGFPNVILEAMAARLPVVTTPAGDAELLVKHEVTGYVVPFSDSETLAARLMDLARSPALRGQLGAAGFEQVTRCFDYAQLPHRLLATYRAIAARQGRRELSGLLSP
jgi:glycosyltransferase involved in cell wall biosynthesis